MQKLLIAFIILLLYSCQKEVEPNQVDNPTQDSSCKLEISRTHSLNGTPLPDSAVYHYHGSKVYKITSGDPADSVVFIYTGNNITRRNHFSSGVLVGYDNLTYNADGSLKKVIKYFNDPFSGNLEVFDSTLFNYSGGKLTKREYYAFDPFASGAVNLEEVNLFSYTGNNMTKEIRIRDTTAGGVGSADTSIIMYDSQPNMLKKQAFPHLQANPMFWDSYAYFLAFLVSENNVVSGRISDDPSSLEVFTYVKDAKGNVLQIIGNGIPMLSYKYKCP